MEIINGYKNKATKAPEVKEKPLLVQIYSVTCGGCQVFKRIHLPALEKEWPLNKIDVLSLTFPQLEIPFSGNLDIGGVVTRYHPQLRMHIQHLPSFILVNPRMWADDNSLLDPIICPATPANYTKDGLLAWIEKTLSSPKLKWKKEDDREKLEKLEKERRENREKAERENRENKERERLERERVDKRFTSSTTNGNRRIPSSLAINFRPAPFDE